MAIDWSLISGFEGGCRTTGYVPDAEGSASGVTIASGVDLSQMGQIAFASLAADVRALLMPYIGLKRQAAAALVRRICQPA